MSAALVAGAGVATDAIASPQRAVRDFAETYAAENTFSGAVLVTQAGRVIYSGAFGAAERAFNAPITQETRFPVASITKLFTATLILRLVDEGRLELDAPIARYLANYPGEDADRVTIRMLLNHTSGLAQFDTVSSYQQAFTEGISAYQRPLSSAQLLSLCCSGPLTRPPGQSFDYNNADYFVLGAIIEQLMGVSYEEALRAQILNPLGLANSGMIHWDSSTPRLATTFFYRDDEHRLVRDMPVYWENWGAAGGIYSSPSDLARFADALYGGDLISSEARTQLLTPGQDDYGLGVWSYSFERRGRVHHVAKRPGSIMGANAVLYRLLDLDTSIIILANTNQTDLDVFAQRLAQVLVDEPAR